MTEGVGELAMFPLGTVLFPTMVLPLRIFEYRYRALIEAVMDGDRAFGVCLIERGSEVGGGELRTDVGTVAQIVDARRFDDGRWAVATVGTRRFRVVEWLEDAPYPRALVADWSDPEPEADLEVERAATVGRLRQVLAMSCELGDRTAPATVDIEVDPVLASYQIGALAPIGAFDRQRLLGAESVIERYSMLDVILADAEALLAHRIGEG